VGTRVKVAVALAVLWSAGLLVAAVTVPVYAVDSGAAGADGGLVTSSGSATLVGANGSGVLAVAVAPLVASVLVGALLTARPRDRVARTVAWAVVGLLAGLAVLGLASVGLFVLPVVVALAVATDARPLPAAAQP
jgi:hypothetical protein